MTGSRQGTSFTMEDMRALIDELEAVNHELESLNDELISSNEDLRRSNEQLRSDHRQGGGRYHELERGARELERLLSVARIAILRFDTRGKLRSATPGAGIRLGLDAAAEELRLADLQLRLPGLDLDALLDRARGSGRSQEGWVRGADGDGRRVVVTAEGCGEDGEGAFVVTVTPTPSAPLAGAAASEAEAHLRLISDHSPEVFCICDPESSKVLYVNPRFEELWGIPADALYKDPRRWLEAVVPEDRDSLAEWLENGFRSEDLQVEYRIQTPDGTIRWIQATGLLVDDEHSGKPRIVGIARDITEEQETRLRLEAMAKHLEGKANRDPLTGLLNRRGMDRALWQEVDRARRSGSRLIAIMVDLDNFKKINDTLGHAAGDVVIRGVADRMRQAMRPADICGRIGGDEFLVLLPEARIAEAHRVAERLRLAVFDNPMTVAEQRVKITASLGVAFVPEDVMTLQEVVTVTGRALATSKDSGKNQVVVEGHQALSGASGNSFAEKIAQRIAQEDCIRSMAQAIHDVSTQEIVAYEMLSRGPVGAYEDPYDLFRVSLENNILARIDLKCLRKALQTCSLLPTVDRIHLNIFPTTILDTPPENLLGLMEEHGGPERFCLELSEQQFLGDPSPIRDQITPLREAGVQIGIDDVGFGRSSLESLIVLEPDVVKIDRAFVHAAKDDEGHRRNLDRLIRSVSSLSATIVAEGVELEEQRQRLEQLGVPYGQGFLWGEPFPVDRDATPS